jgi:hypothetical protein
LPNQQDDIWQQRLVRHLGHTSWMRFLYKYNDSHLLIADSFFLDAVRRAKKARLAIHLASVDDWQDAIDENIKKILVFTQRDELAVVREIHARYPDMHVTSGTYQFMVSGQKRQMKMRPYPSAKFVKPKQPLLIISTPYANAEFVAKAMDSAGMPFAYEYFSRALGTWLERFDRFQVARYFAVVMRNFTKQGRISTLVQTDVLSSVMASGNLSVRRLKSFLKATNAKVILVNRRDHFAQAGEGQLLNRSAERSMCSLRLGARIDDAYQPTDITGCLARLKAIKEGEQLLSDLAASDLNTHSICIEEFVADQQAGLEKISEQFGWQRPVDYEELDYVAPYNEKPGMSTVATKFRRELSDRAGIHVASLPDAP